MNLNELEFSDTNADELKKRGYVLANNESNTVLGSADTAKKAFETGGGTEKECAKMNFCSSRYKDAVQLRLRLLRTARQNARPFDEITEDGTIIYGRINVPDSFLKPFVSFLKENELPDEAYEIKEEQNRIETACGIVEELAASFEEELTEFGGVQLWIIEQYPMTGGFVVGSERIF